MKTERQELILKLVAEHPIQTQEDLASLLESSGHHVTQATVSRDIRMLRLVKRMNADGIYCYHLPEQLSDPEGERHLRLLSELVLSADESESLVVVKTRPGAAGTAAEAIDAISWPEILGTLAGDNTILLVARTRTEAPQIAKRLRALIH